VKLAVRPRSFHGSVQVVASGPRRLTARAHGGHGTYRARLVFPRSGVWKLTARAGASPSRLGSIHVRAARLVFDEPTGIAAGPDGSLLVVESGLLRLLRVSPGGRVNRIVTFTKPWGVARTPSGTIFASDLGWLKRIDPGHTPTIVATADPGIEIGPIAVLPNGDVVYSTVSGLYRVAGGVAGAPQRLAPQISLSGPHGIAATANGTLLVSDTGNNLVWRIDPASGLVTPFAAIAHPRGIGVAPDGTVYVAAADERRVVRFSASGERLGAVGPRFGDPYALTLAPDGTVYAIDAGARGFIRRIAPDGTSSVVTGP
jgi:DNA-binding beta-propeller fold protein YncE